MGRSSNNLLHLSSESFFQIFLVKCGKAGQEVWFFSYKIRQSFHTLKQVVCSEMNIIFRSRYLGMPYQRIWRHPQILPSLILVETGVCVGASTLILIL